MHGSEDAWSEPRGQSIEQVFFIRYAVIMFDGVAVRQFFGPLGSLHADV